MLSPPENKNLSYSLRSAVFKRMIDQNIAAADDGTDTACKVFRTDRQVDAGWHLPEKNAFPHLKD